MAITKTWWGNHDGQDVFLFKLSNGRLELTVSNFGCTIIAIEMPNAEGIRQNLVLGYQSLEGYLTDRYYMGCIVGRFANRIARARFTIGEKEYLLAANETGTPNHLHGGFRGFNKKVFTSSGELLILQENTLTFSYISPHGDEGYPGNLALSITYRLTNDNEVIIQYAAITDQPTPVNLTSHCYFNLSSSNKSAMAQELYLNADHVVEADEHAIPTGKILATTKTPLDFTTARRMDSLPRSGGYNDCFLLNETGTSKSAQAVLKDKASGRAMTVRTTLPGIMLYTGDHLGGCFEKNQGICLEAQFLPDSPNQPQFPNTILKPGDQYLHTTIYQFA
jgi:aldose 1-epimerase